MERHGKVGGMQGDGMVRLHGGSVVWLDWPAFPRKQKLGLRSMSFTFIGEKDPREQNEEYREGDREGGRVNLKMCY